MEFEKLVSLLQEVKPSLQGRTLAPENSIVDELGLDSLDLLQLGRRIQRASGVSFVQEEWAAAERCKDAPRFTIASMLKSIEAQAARL
jgi:acyl carrier protein